MPVPDRPGGFFDWVIILIYGVTNMARQYDFIE
jgi:hypothetical protein